MLGGCGSIPGIQGNALDPVIVSGVAVDFERQPVGGARLELRVVDGGAVDPQGERPVIYQETFTANANGTFAIHCAPRPELVAFAARQGGLVMFELHARTPDGVLFAYFSFGHTIVDGTWADIRQTPVVLSPDGVEVTATPAPAR